MTVQTLRTHPVFIFTVPRGMKAATSDARKPKATRRNNQFVPHLISSESVRITFRKCGTRSWNAGTNTLGIPKG